MLKTHTLKNGLKAATYSIPQMRSVFLSIGVKGGSIFDTEEKSGVAHFMEHILVQGIPSLPDVTAFSTFIESLAGSYSAVTYPQSVRFTINLPSNHLNDAVRIASEVFSAPLFPQAAVEREREVILSEIKERQDELWYKNNKFFAGVRYKKGHPLLLDTGGSLEAVEKLTKKDLVKFWSSFFYPQNTYLTMVGGFEDTATKDALENFFGGYVSNKKFPGFPKFTRQDLSERTVALRCDPTLKVSYVDLTFPSIWGEKPLGERMQQSIAASILGGLRRSRLYRLLRQQRGLVYGVSFGSAVYETFGYAGVSTQVLKENLDEVIGLIAKELSSFYKNGPTEEEVQFAKNYHKNRAFMQFDHPSGIADWIEGDLLWEKKVYTPEEHVQIIESVNVRSIKEFIRKYWDFGKLNLVIQGPVEDSKANIKKFADLISPIK